MDKTDKLRCMRPLITRRTVIAGGLALLATPALGSRAAAMPSSPLRIGVLADLTGPLARMGKQIRSGIGTRAGTLGGTGGHSGGGSMFELLMADTAAGEREAVTGLLEQGVHALVGSGDPVASLGNTSCTPTILIHGTATGPFVFQAGPSAAQVNRAQLAAVKKAGLTSAGQLSADPADRESFAAQGIQLTGAQLVPLDATSLAPQAAALVAQAPQAVVVNAPPPLEALAVKELRAAGFTGPIFCSPSATDPGFQSAAGEQAAEGVKAVSPWLPALTEAPDTVPHLTMMRRFAESYLMEFGKPGAHAGYAADALSLLHLAYLGHRDRKQAQAQLEQMCCIGVTGVYNMSPSKHDGLDPAALTTLVSSGGGWKADT